MQESYPIKPELVQEFQTLNAASRRDPVAEVCRGLFFRVECCPCLQRPSCSMCRHDCERIEMAWGLPVK